MFAVDDKDIKRFERDLKTFASRAYPFATKATINTAAFRTQKVARERISRDLTLRNKFTQQSIRVEQAKGLNVKTQAAFVGSIADYMADQEFGGTKRRKGSEGVAIPTSYSAGQGLAARPRTRLPRKPNRLQSIRLKQQRRKGSNRVQRNLVAIKQAATSGSKFVFLDLQKSKGIFKVIGGKRRPKIRMVHDLTRTSVRIPRKPWLAPSVDQVTPQIRGIYGDALVFQMKRQKIFRP